MANLATLSSHSHGFYILHLHSFIISKAECLEGVKCVPSAERPSPGKLGYYIGGHTGTVVHTL
jgi:hypothetical protein